MTPLYPDDADHTGDTVLYRAAETRFGAPLAAPAIPPTEREAQLLQRVWEAERDEASALHREGNALYRAEVAEARLEIARGTALRALAKVRELEAALALDRLSRTVTGRSAAMTAEELTTAMARWPDAKPAVRTGRAIDAYEADTVVIDTLTGGHQ